MKRTVFLATGLLLLLSGWVNAQSVPPPPAPIVESDIRDNTIKMRSIELERVKREADKARPAESTREREMRFAEIKNDFEGIQKLQDAIIAAYTKGEKVNYSKIGRSAAAMRTEAFRLDKNLFGEKEERKVENKKARNNKRESVRKLIIELDNSIGRFIKSPIFQNTKIVDSKISERAQKELENIIQLSEMLSIESEKMK